MGLDRVCGAIEWMAMIEALSCVFQQQVSNFENGGVRVMCDEMRSRDAMMCDVRHEP